ncbi:MAG: glycerol-3-phosphate dehydrogenase subunit C [Gammaproteobacteria bacterium]|jgi:glycerol-3-phosphate dehydrogenase subunit C
MSDEVTTSEGGLGAPTRHPLGWKEAKFYDEGDLFTELERVFDICHGCRRCVSLCNSFPTLFDLVDESKTMEVDGVNKADYFKVVDQCYLCDLCYLTKCPYVPPHEWNVDYPHLMLRAKAVNHEKGGTSFRDKLLTSTDQIGKLASIPVVVEIVNKANELKLTRKLLEKTLGVHADAPLPKYSSNSARKRVGKRDLGKVSVNETAHTTGRIAIFLTCYGNRNAPQMVEDLALILSHNEIDVAITESERCCGMPKLELGDLPAVEKLKNHNIPELMKLVRRGYDLTAPIPSCVLMYKQELPLMFPDDEDVLAVAKAFFDPFEYMMLRHREQRLDLKFAHSIGTVAYHVPCHQRVQKIGPKTKDILELVPETVVTVIERCSGHDGTYAVKRENYAIAQKICRPVVRRVEEARADHFISDCPMAGDLIQHGRPEGVATSAFALLRHAYGI